MKATPQSPDSEKAHSFRYDKYLEIKHLDLRNYVISLQKGSYFSDTLEDPQVGYPKNNVIVVHGKKDKSSDTLTLETSDDIDDCTVTDVSDSLHFKLCIEIAWSGDSDVPMSEFVGYWKDSLRTMFTLADLQSLRRENDGTLTGFVGSRDEVVGAHQTDYPITISSQDFSISGDDPPVQQIDYFTHANENLKGRRLTRAGTLVPYTIRKGTDVMVDTIYRKKGIVRLVVSDSIIIYTPVGAAHEKLQVNAAG